LGSLTIVRDIRGDCDRRTVFYILEYNNTCNEEFKCNETNFIINIVNVNLNCPSQCSVLSSDDYILKLNSSDEYGNIFNMTPLYITLNTTVSPSIVRPVINNDNIINTGDNISDSQLKILALLIIMWLGCAFIGFSFKQSVFLILSYLIGIFTGLLIFAWVYWWLGISMILLNISLMFVTLKK
jgi:hypothetical protein